MTFATDIERVADNESIVGIVIGGFGWGDFDEEEGYGEDRIGKPPIVPLNKRGIVLTWEETRPYLDYEYDRGYGAPECHSITAWTENKVIFVSTYDGSTAVVSVPRNPVNHVPEMTGGG